MDTIPPETIIHIAKYIDRPRDYLNLIQVNSNLWNILSSSQLIIAEVLKNRFGGNMTTTLLFLYGKGKESVISAILTAKWEINDIEPILTYLLENELSNEFIQLWNAFPSFRFSRFNENLIIRKALDKKDNIFLKTLIERGIDLNDRPKILLYTAVCDGKLDKLKLLIENGINVAGYHYSMLEIASLNKWLSIFKYLIEDLKFPINTGFSDYLSNTCLNQDEDFFNYLISKSEGNIPQTTINLAFIHLFQGLQKKMLSKHILNTLIDMGADINIQGGFALEVSIRRNSVFLVRYLLQKGAAVHFGTENGDLLSIACEMGSETIVSLLLKNGANPWSYNSQSVKYLIKNKMNKLLKFVLEKNENMYLIDWQELLNNAYAHLNFEGATIIWKAKK